MDMQSCPGCLWSLMRIPLSFSKTYLEFIFQHHNHNFKRFFFFERHIVGDLFPSPFFIFQSIAHDAVRPLEARIEMKGHISTRLHAAPALQIDLEPARARRKGRVGAQKEAAGGSPASTKLQPQRLRTEPLFTHPGGLNTFLQNLPFLPQCRALSWGWGPVYAEQEPTFSSLPGRQVASGARGSTEVQMLREDSRMAPVSRHLSFVHSPPLPTPPKLYRHPPSYPDLV